MKSVVTNKMNLLHLFLLYLSVASAATTTRPNKPRAFIQTVIKDPITNLYFTTIDIGTNYTVSVSFVIDLAAPYTWYDCFSGYSSSSYTPIHFHSPKCKLVNNTTPNNVPIPDWLVCSDAKEKVVPGCFDNPCGLNPYNPGDKSLLNGTLGEDRMFFYSIPDGLSFGYRFRSPPVIFACVSRYSYKGLPGEAQGILSLSKNALSLPSLFSSNFPPIFALCLSSKEEELGYGDLFVGGGPYFLPPYSYDASRLFTTVSLIAKEASDEYFFKVESIEVEGNAILLEDSTLFKLSTTTPFTVVHHSVYDAFIKEFKAKAASKKMVEVETVVAPFEVCYRLKKGFKMEDVPVVDLTVGSGGGRWRIHGWNSMVVVKKGVMCLAFVKGEEMVIGGYQMEDNLVEIDLRLSKLSFTSSLLRYNTSCCHKRPVVWDTIPRPPLFSF